MSDLKPEPYPDDWESPRTAQEARETNLLIKVAELQAQLEQMQVELDNAKKVWKYWQDREDVVSRNSDLHYKAWKAVEAERDAARAAAARYKRRAEAVYRYWCSYWGSRADWGMLRDVLGTLKEAQDD